LKVLAAKEADLRKHGGGLSGDERRNVDTLKRRLGLLRESQTLVRVAAAREVAIDRLSRSEASCPVRLMAALLLAAR
jgi:hypothetical protein